MRTVVHTGDCREVMLSLDEGSVHAVVTDPPYGLNFMGRGWDRGVPGTEFWSEALRVAKPGAHLVAFGGTRTYHRLACAIEDAGWEIRDCLQWIYGSGFPKSLNVSKAAWGEFGPWPSPGAQAYANAERVALDFGGHGTALKPSYEPVILARKPLAGTVAANVLQHGCGALNVDGCRIEGAPPSVPQPAFNSRTGNTYGMKTGEGRSGEMSNATGRWPANVVLGCACESDRHDPECAVAILDEQSGDDRGTHGRGEVAYDRSSGVCYGMFERTGRQALQASSGGASRFYYTAKATRAEREAGLEHRRRRVVHDGRKTSIDNPYLRADTQRANTHPTVKPVSLMRWLVRLVGGKRGSVILDPFCGSGTTGIACALEGFEFIGIDLDPEHCEIARARILNATECSGTLTTEQIETVPDKGGPVQLGLLSNVE